MDEVQRQRKYGHNDEHLRNVYFIFHAALQ